MAPMAAGNLALSSSASAAILLMVLLAAAAAVPSAASRIDVAALMVFKNGIRDPNGELASWVWDPDLLNPCNWFYVTCDYRDQRVTGIHLEELGISGVLTPYLAKLESLKYLGITWNLIEGSIPIEFGQMENLVSLDLYGNWISGPISPRLENLQSLGYMRVDHNRLTGKIPGELGGLPNLLILDLSSNDLCGKVRTSLERFPLSSFADNPRLKYPPMDGVRSSDITSDDTGC